MVRWCAAVAAVALASVAGAQTPQTPATQPSPGPAEQAGGPGAPSPAVAYFPVYPAAQFIAAYDAGRGQQYLLYGSTTPFVDIVNYYRTQLRERGNQVFDEPLTHMFEVGRFRAESMAFPPGVTVKDWTSGGSKGYPNPRPGTEPARYPTIIMIVPPPPAAAAAERSAN